MRIKHLGPVNHGLEENSRKSLSKSNRHRFEIHGLYAILNSLTSLGAAYIGNINWKQIMYIGNMHRILPISKWKHNLDI